MTEPAFGEYTVHPAAELFPLLGEKELDELAADIKAHGLQNLIIVHDKMILDGRNRFLACKRAGVPPLTDYYRGTGSPTAWVFSQNLHRRHLTESQRAMVAVQLVAIFEAEAQERQRQGGREKVRANLPEAGRARDKAAALADVSGRTMQDAAKVAREGSAEMVDAVKDGKLAVSAAANALRASKAQVVTGPAARRRRSLHRKWSLPWPIEAMASVIRRRREPAEIAELVRLLSDAGKA